MHRLLRSEFERLRGTPEQLTLFQNKIFSLLRPRSGAKQTAENIEAAMVPLREQLWWVLLVPPSLPPSSASASSAAATSQHGLQPIQTASAISQWILSRAAELRLFDGVHPWLLAEVSVHHSAVCEAYGMHLLLRTQNLCTLANMPTGEYKKLNRVLHRI